MSERILSGWAPAYFTSSSDAGPDDLETFDRAMDALTVATHCKNSLDLPGYGIADTAFGQVRIPRGWILVGFAEIKLILSDDRALVASKVQSLEAQERTLRAETEARCIEIRRRINTLLAITNEVAP